MSSIVNAIKVSLAVSFVGIFISFFTAFILYFLLKKVPEKIRIFFEIVISLPVFLSPAVIGYILLVVLGTKGFIGSVIYDFFSYRLIFTKSAAVIVFIIVSIPILYQNMKIALDSVDKSCIESARVMGANELQVLIYIILPLSMKGILAGTILGFGRGFGEFGATIMVAGNIPGKTQTIPMAVYTLAESGQDSEAKILVLTVFFFSSALIFLYSKLTNKKNS